MRIFRAIALVLATAGLFGLMLPKPESARGAGTYHIVGRPIVPIEEASGGAVFDVYLRLNRSLPRTAFGRLQAALWLDDSGGDASVATLGRRARHCYTAPIDPSFSMSSALQHPRVGRRVTVKLYVADRVVVTSTATLSRSKHSNSEDQNAPYASRLGC